MIGYEEIDRVNRELSTVDIKGKNYVVVPQRIKAFRMLYPQGFILTDILSHDDGVVVMQAKAGYYDDRGEPVVLGSGLAFEKQDSTYINRTSYIENCETSAIGRALGFLGLGIDAAICSAEELINAVTNQEKDQEKDQQPPRAPAKPAPAAKKTEVTTSAAVPAPKKAETLPPAKPEKPETPGSYLKRMIARMNQEIDGFNFIEARKTLIKSGAVPDIPSATMSMAQAYQLVSAIFDHYGKKAS